MVDLVDDPEYVVPWSLSEPSREVYDLSRAERAGTLIAQLEAVAGELEMGSPDRSDGAAWISVDAALRDVRRAILALAQLDAISAVPEGRWLPER